MNKQQIHRILSTSVWVMALGLILAMLLPLWSGAAGAYFLRQTVVNLLAPLILIAGLIVGRLDTKPMPKRTWLDLVVLAWWLFSLVATLLSSSWSASLLGIDGRLSAGLWGVSSWVMIYFGLRSGIRTHGRALWLQRTWLLVGSAHLIWGLSQVSGFNPSGQAMALPSGGLGTPFLFALVCAVLLLLGLSQVLNRPKDGWRLAYGLLAVGGLLGIGLANVLVGWVLLLPVVGWLGLRWVQQTKWPLQKVLLSLLGVIAVGGVSMLLAWWLTGRAPIVQNLMLPEEGWTAAAMISQGSPLWGVGPEMLVYAFEQIRPVAFNLGDLVNLKFPLAYNEYFTILANLGYGGLLVFALLLGRAFKLGSVRLQSEKLLAEETGVWPFVGLLVVVYWALAGMDPTSALLFWMSLALLAGTRQAQPHPPRSASLKGRDQQLVWLTAGLGGALALVVLVAGVNWWRAERQIAQLISANQRGQALSVFAESPALQAVTSFDEARRLFPWVDIYHRTYAAQVMSLLDAQGAQVGQDEQSRQAFASAATESLESAKQALTKARELNPTQVDNWLRSAELTLYQATSEDIPPAALDQAEYAFRLAPRSPYVSMMLGSLHEQSSEPDQALGYYQAAIQSKPDWWIPRYRASLLLIEAEAWQAAYDQLDMIDQILASTGEQLPEATRVELDRVRQQVEEQLKEATAEESPAE